VFQTPVVLRLGGLLPAYSKPSNQIEKKRVSINGTVSDWASVRSGVPQGSVLGPILFVAFINNLPEAMSSVCSMYADDTKVYISVKDASNKAQLQDDLDS
jgi:hypothetical protein